MTPPMGPTVIIAAISIREKLLRAQSVPMDLYGPHYRFPEPFQG